MNTGCVIGIGCDDHGDQIAGLLVAREVAARSRGVSPDAPGAITVVESTGSPDHLVRAWDGHGGVVIVEAMPGQVPGAIHRCRPHPRPLGFGCSSTRLSARLREALARGPLPGRVTVITIEACCFVQHAPVTPAVARAAAEVAAGIVPDVVPALANA